MSKVRRWFKKKNNSKLTSRCDFLAFYSVFIILLFAVSKMWFFFSYDFPRHWTLTPLIFKCSLNITVLKTSWLSYFSFYIYLVIIIIHNYYFKRTEVSWGLLKLERLLHPSLNHLSCCLLFSVSSLFLVSSFALRNHSVFPSLIFLFCELESQINC